MSSGLEKLRELMDDSVYKEKRFTDKEMKKLFRNVRSKEKRILWIPMTLTVIFTSSFFGLGGMYLHDYLIIDGEVKSWHETTSEGWEDSPGGTSITGEWNNIHSSELNIPDFIFAAFLEDEEFLSDFRGPVRFPKRNGENTLLRHRYTSGVDSSEHLIIEQWHTSSGSPAWLEEKMKQPETKEIVKSSDTSIYLQNDGEENIGFFSKGKLSFFVTVNSEFMSLAEVQRILEKITEGRDFNRMIDYEGRP